MAPIRIKWIEYPDIRSVAEKFLDKYHPEGTIPVPIHEIVDVKLGIDIVPRLGLQGDLGLVGYISKDLQTITVDEYIYDYVEVRFRFTLAHEIGHAIIHKYVYESAIFESPDEWKEFQRNLSDEERKKFEWQANCFAGVVLVPSDKLNDLVCEAIKKIDESGISLERNWDFAWFSIEDQLSHQFEVSMETIQARLYYEKIQDRYRKTN